MDKDLSRQSDRQEMAPPQAFLVCLNSTLSDSSLVKLVLGKYRGAESGLSNIIVRPITLRAHPCLSFVYRYQTRDVTRNLPIPEGEALIRSLLGREFKSGHLFALAETVQIEFNKRGEGRMSRSPAMTPAAPDQEHDHAKERMIEPSRPFLQELGITKAAGQVLPSMSRKWKQINVFLALFQRALSASGLAQKGSLEVVDFGSGKGYLTFAVYDFLKTQALDASVTGIERRDDLVRFCREAAARLKMDGLSFHQGDIKSYQPGAVDIMIALHACDTATDLAIHMGIRSDARIIMCAPCCHKEIRPQMVNPAVLEPLLRFGIHQGQEAEMLTDTLRALWLEASGYETQVFEFVSLEHTSKNKMILAVKRAQPVAPGPILEQIKALKNFYGIREHTLETLLKDNQLTTPPAFPAVPGIARSG